MKKLLAGVMCVGVLATGVFAEATDKFINFEFSSIVMGTAGSKTAVSGNSFILSFDLDDSVKVGVLQENLGLSLTQGGATVSGTMTVNAINLDYKVAEKVTTGINVGSAVIPAAITAGTSTIAASSAALSDIYVKGVHKVGKKGEVNISLGYRIMAVSDTGAANAFENMNGIIAKVGFSVGF